MNTATRRVLVDAALIAVAAADAFGSLLADDDHAITPVRAAISAIAVLALCFRERAPYLVFLVTLPAVVVTNAVIASLVALFTVAHRRPLDWRLVGCAVAMFIGYTSLWDEQYRGVVSVINAAYAVVFTAAPVWLGLLMRARAALSEKLNQIERARQHEHQLLLERALALERAALAREMHDVVSHQVSLIAVQAGALQVTATDHSSTATARTIRTLAVRTLDELREMVGVLRPSDDRELQLAPQPGIADIPALVQASGVTTTVHHVREADVEPSAAVQRATYRAVQEGLTNVTKHAPGATATLDLRVEASEVRISLTNTAPTQAADPLPSARHGLLGLRERAALLGGSLYAEALDDGGYRLSMTLPANVQPTDLVVPRS